MIAHVGANERWMAGQLEALQSGELPTAQSCYGCDEVREMAAAAHARLLAAMESFSDDQLSEELAIAELGTTGHVRKPIAGEQGWPLWEWLRGVTYHHYANHARGVRAVAGT